VLLHDPVVLGAEDNLSIVRIICAVRESVPFIQYVLYVHSNVSVHWTITVYHAFTLSQRESSATWVCTILHLMLSKDGCNQCKRALLACLEIYWHEDYLVTCSWKWFRKTQRCWECHYLVHRFTCLSLAPLHCNHLLLKQIDRHVWIPLPLTHEGEVSLKQRQK
jgi:hypothetical protein